MLRHLLACEEFEGGPCESAVVWGYIVASFAAVIQTPSAAAGTVWSKRALLGKTYPAKDSAKERCNLPFPNVQYRSGVRSVR